jgi:hypothetical protein
MKNFWNGFEKTAANRWQKELAKNFGESFGAKGISYRNLFGGSKISKIPSPDDTAKMLRSRHPEFKSVTESRLSSDLFELERAKDKFRAKHRPDLYPTDTIQKRLEKKKGRELASSKLNKLLEGVK